MDLPTIYVKEERTEKIGEMMVSAEHPVEKAVRLAQLEMCQAFAASASTAWLSFRQRLFWLMAHADGQIIDQLGTIFPLEAAVYMAYRSGGPANIFLEKYQYKAA